MGFSAMWYLIPISLSPFIVLMGRELYIKYIRPSKYYKLTVFDATEEVIKFVKKREAIIIQDKKGFILFTNKDKSKGEFYTVSTDTEDLPSKRDNMGTVSFYYWRNNSNPIKFKDGNDYKYSAVKKGFAKKNTKREIIITDVNTPINVESNSPIEIDNDAELMYKVFKTKLFDSALLEDVSKPFSFSKQAILFIIVGLVAIFIFLGKQQGWF